MAWTYTQSPNTDPQDEVRFLVGDTDPAEPLIQDEEIDYYLVHHPKAPGKPAWLASAAVAEAIAAQFARRADRSIGSLSISAKQQHDHYVELAARLRMLHLTNGLGPSIGGLGIRGAVPRLGKSSRTAGSIPMTSGPRFGSP